MSRILLTKLDNVSDNSPEWHYNKALGHTRSWVEQTFGQLLNKWRIIGKEKRPHYSEQKVRDIVIATAVLHNFEKRDGLVREFSRLLIKTTLLNFL